MAKQESNSNEELATLCPHCHESITANWRNGFFHTGWRLDDDECPFCHRTVKLSGRIKTLRCPHCQTQVERLKDGLCPKCGKQLYRQNDFIKITCPTCGTIKLIEKAPKGELRCDNCNEIIPERVVNAYKAVEPNDPELITLPSSTELNAKEKNIIWKLPREEFPYKSRVIVKAGTLGLLLHNGECQDALSPGDHLLVDTKFTREEKFDNALNGASTVFKTDIYCVAAALPSYTYGPCTDQVKEKTTGLIATVGCTATIDLTVDDPIAFADMFDFRELSTRELFACESPDNTGILIEKLRTTSREAFTRVVKSLSDQDIPFNELQLKKGDIQQAIRKELDLELGRFGLGIREFTLHVQDGFAIHLSTVSKPIENKEQIERLISTTRFPWEVNGIHVCVNKAQNIYADFNVSGGVSFETDEDVFFENPKVRELLVQPLKVSSADVSHVAMDGFFLPLLRTQLAAATQTVIVAREGDLHEMPVLIDELEQVLIPSLDKKLIPYGLKIRALDMNQPTMTASVFQKDELSLRESKENIITWVERPLSWQVNNALIHVKDHPEYKAHVSFTGTCSFRVPDKEAYFELSEVKDYLKHASVLKPDTVSQDYARRINDNFKPYLQTVTQNIVDGYDADPRYLDHFRVNIVDGLVAAVSDLIHGWGLTISTGDLNITDVQVKLGPILLANIGCLEGKAKSPVDTH